MPRARPPLGTLTQGQQQRQRSSHLRGSKSDTLHDCDEDLLGDEALEQWAADEPECMLAVLAPGRSDQPLTAWETGPTSRPPCDRPRCRSRRVALRNAQRRLERAHLAVIMQAWRRQVQLQRAQQEAALHSAQLDGALDERVEMEGARRELQVQLEAASQQLAEQRTATAAVEQALHSAQLDGALGERDKLEGARRATARSLAAAGLRQSRRVAALEAQLEAISRQLAEQGAAAAEAAVAAAEAAAAAKQAMMVAGQAVIRVTEQARQARQASEDEVVRRREAQQAEQAATAEARKAWYKLQQCRLELKGVEVELQAERSARQGSGRGVAAARRLGVAEGREQASHRPRLPGSQRPPVDGDCPYRRRSLEAVLLERRQRRCATMAGACATRDVAEPRAEREEPRESLELWLVLALLACAFLSAV